MAAAEAVCATAALLALASCETLLVAAAPAELASSLRPSASKSAQSCVSIGHARAALALRPLILILVLVRLLRGARVAVRHGTAGQVLRGGAARCMGRAMRAANCHGLEWAGAARNSGGGGGRGRGRARRGGGGGGGGGGG